MSKELPTNPKPNEEVDLILFFNLIGNAISKVLNFVGGILKSIFSTVIYALKALFKSWKIVGSVIVIAAICGYFLEKNKPTVYDTSMLVEPYFNSNYRLVNNIDYFNALIANKDTEALKKIFNVEESIINQVIGFDIEPGPETENDRLLQYEAFIGKLDTIRAQQYPYEEFIKNRSVYSGKYFLIKAKAHKADVFKVLEEGILSTFNNNYFEKEMGQRDELREIQKQNLEDQLVQVLALQKVYISILEKESENKKGAVSLGSEISISSSDKQNTKEYELLREEQKIRNELNILRGDKIKQKVVYDLISGFQDVGNISKKWTDRYVLIFPVLAFIFLILFFIGKKIVIFTLNYED